jgi:hypothetical protein
VGDLEENPGGKTMHGRGDPGEPRDEAIVRYGQLARAGLAFKPDEGMARDDQADLALRQSGIKLDLPVGRFAVVRGQEVLGRRAHEPVGNHHVADLDRGEED